MLLCTPSPDLSSLGPLLYVCGWHEWKSDLVFMGILAHEGSLWVLIDTMKKTGYEDILNDEELEWDLKEQQRFPLLLASV